MIFCVQYPVVPANYPLQDSVSIDIHRPMLTCMAQAAKESCEARRLRFQSGGYRISGRLWCRAKPGHVQQGSGEGSGEGVGLDGFGAEPGQVQQGAGEGLGGFGAEPGLVQQGFGEGSGEGVGNFGAEVRFNRVPEKVRKKVLEKVPEKVCEALVQSQVRFNRICRRLIHGNHVEVFAALGFAALFRTICKNKTLRLLWIPQKLIFICVCLRNKGIQNPHSS